MTRLEDLAERIGSWRPTWEHAAFAVATVVAGLLAIAVLEVAA